MTQSGHAAWPTGQKKGSVNPGLRTYTTKM